MKKSTASHIAVAAIALCSALAAHAGRPLAVDDANTNDKGAGHVEAWVTRNDTKASVLTIAPAYAPIDNVEIAGSYARDTTNSTSAQSLQVKWRITPSQEKGCNYATVLGVSHASGGGNNPFYLNGNATCNGLGPVSVHANIGITKASGVAGVKTWGVAAEMPFGEVTGHVETFGQEGSKPTLQVGARTQITKTIQLDGTIGRSNDETIYSVGVKFQF
jgi:hypothetical protein